MSSNSIFTEGFQFILDHFNQERLFPRTIMTKKLKYQKEVFSKEEARRLFEESNFIDCRINAYPVLEDGVLQAPNIIFIDLDLSSTLNELNKNLVHNKKN